MLNALRAELSSTPHWAVLAASTGDRYEFNGTEVQEQHAFAYDTRRATLLEPPRVFMDKSRAFTRPPVLAEFLLAPGGVRVTLCSVHLKYGDNAAREASALGNTVLAWLRTELGARAREVIFLGDFNLAPPASVGGLPLEPAPGRAFRRLQAAGWRHANEAATNAACFTQEPRVYDNVWCAPQMAELLVRNSEGKLATVVCTDEAVFQNWRDASAAEEGVTTREQLNKFQQWLCAANASQGGTLAANEKPTAAKIFSHLGCSDHRLLFVTLRTTEDAARSLRAPAALPPLLAAPELRQEASAMQAAVLELADVLLDGDVPAQLQQRVAAAFEELRAHTDAMLAATDRIVLAAVELGVPTAQAAAQPPSPATSPQPLDPRPQAPEAIPRCAGTTNKGVRCKITWNLFKWPPGVYFCEWHQHQGKCAPI
jgi:hypothetical protein